MKMTQILRRLPAATNWMVVFELAPLRALADDNLIKELSFLAPDFDLEHWSHVGLTSKGRFLAPLETGDLVDGENGQPWKQVQKGSLAEANLNWCEAFPPDQAHAFALATNPDGRKVLLHITIDGEVASAKALFREEPATDHYELLTAAGIEYAETRRHPLGAVLAALSGKVQMGADWRTATRESAGIAPDPAVVRDSLVQVYGARSTSWRAAFAMHTWIATKRQDAEEFMVYEVNGLRSWHGQSPLAWRADRHPDRHWYGAKPRVYHERRGADAEALIDQIEAAVAAYPHKDAFRMWPGPNCNTFTAHVARMVPDLRLDLPPTAVGKDYLGNTTFAAAAPSGTGYQVSLFGVLGLLVGLEEGVEFNLLGLTVGIDPMDLSVKLPGLGRLGLGAA